jgi:hypothetical protein
LRTELAAARLRAATEEQRPKGLYGKQRDESMGLEPDVMDEIDGGQVVRMILQPTMAHTTRKNGTLEDRVAITLRHRICRTARDSPIDKEP